MHKYENKIQKKLIEDKESFSFEFTVDFEDKKYNHKEQKHYIAIYMHYNPNNNKNGYFITEKHNYDNYKFGEMEECYFWLGIGILTYEKEFNSNLTVEQIIDMFSKELQAKYKSPMKFESEQLEFKNKQADVERKNYWWLERTVNENNQKLARREIKNIKKKNHGLNLKTTKQMELETREEIGNIKNRDMLVKVIEEKINETREKIYELTLKVTEGKDATTVEKYTDKLTEEQATKLCVVNQKMLSLLFLQDLNWDYKYVLTPDTGCDLID